jgi:tetratricopeptide (TPR) repeat protein
MFHADRGEVEMAAVDFNAALDAYPDQDRWSHGQKVYLAAVQNDAVFNLLSANRNDGELHFTKMIHHLRRNELKEAGAIALYWLDPARHAQEGQAPAGFMATLVICGHQEEFERWREIVQTNQFDEDNHVANYHKALSLGLAPTSGKMTTELLKTAIRCVAKGPQRGSWYAGTLGLAQLRAQMLDEAMETLESAEDFDSNQPTVGVTWPVLAMVHHHRGDRLKAGTYLKKTERLLQQHRTALESGNYDTIAWPTFMTQRWLLSTLFYREAKTLIEGPEESGDNKNEPVAPKP